MIKATANEIKIMHTKCMGPDDMISSLSGGNQQKVIFGKWLERSPQVFMMDERPEELMLVQNMKFTT